MPCSECNGKGKVLKLDILKARREWDTCPICKGQPHKEDLKPDGIRIVHVRCQVVEWVEYKDNVSASKLELWICPILKDNKPMMVRDTPLAKPRPRVYAIIRDMNTKEEYRKQGMMDRLLICAHQNKQVEWFETSWDDSTEDGRGFLLKRGFVREGKRLISRRPTTPSGN